MTDPFNRDPTARHGIAEDVFGGEMRVRRITCNNPSPMTFTGTQTYLLGDGADQAVIDPGPADETHIDAILAATGGHVGHIFVTHSHVDHSPGASILAARTGAVITGFGPHGTGMSATMEALSRTARIGGGEGGDRSFQPGQIMADGETMASGAWSLTALHTPGHLSNHLSFALGETGVVFTGDTVMGWATTLVSPPEGDMAAFMRSLDLLEGREDLLYLPGHGHPVTEPLAMIAHQKAHRLSRATQVMSALADGPATAKVLTASIYRDIDPALLPAAARNVLATLLWKQDAGEVATNDPPGADAVFHRI